MNESIYTTCQASHKSHHLIRIIYFFFVGPHDCLKTSPVRSAGAVFVPDQCLNLDMTLTFEHLQGTTLCMGVKGHTGVNGRDKLRGWDRGDR